MSHRGFMGARKKGVDPCAYVPGLYTEAEVDDLINIDGYIPVASAAEYRRITTGNSEDMGGCSQWAGTYTTGLDKKYIQIFDIDFEQVSTDFSGNTEATFVYDGNELKQDNMPDALFGTNSSGNVDSEIRNLRISTDFGVLVAGVGGFAVSRTNRCLVTNVIANVRCKKTGGNPFSALYENQSDVGRTRNSRVIVDFYECEVSCGAFANGMRGEWTDCHSEGEIDSTANSIGGFGGNQLADGSYLRCSARVDVNGGSSTASFIGGGTGTGLTITADECFAIGTVNGTNAVALFWGQNRRGLTVRNCYSRGVVTGSSFRAAGFICDPYAATTIENCYSAAEVSGASSNLGLVNFIQTGSTVTSSHWDTTIGPATSNGGAGARGRTTPQMQEGSEDSYILPGGGVDGGSDPDNLMYENWDPLIWEFLPGNAYPTLINNPE